MSTLDSHSHSVSPQPLHSNGYSSATDDERRPLVSGERKGSKTGDLLEPALSVSNFTLTQFGKNVVLVACIIAFRTLEPVFISNSKDGHTFPYNFTVVVILVEICKLIVSLILFAIEVGVEYYHSQSQFSAIRDRPDSVMRIARAEVAKFSKVEALLYMVPAVLYTGNNNLQFVILETVSPATFQVVSNLNIPPTAILMTCVIGTRLTRVQWASIILLTVAATCTQMRCDAMHYFQSGAIIGLSLTLVNCLTTAVAGVFIEWQLKGNVSASLNLQNILLYGYSVIVNGLVMVMRGKLDGHPFEGFDDRTYLVLSVGIAVGLSTSLILKWMSNIAFIFSKQGAIIATVIVSPYLLTNDEAREFSGMFLCGMLLLFVSVYLYNHVPPEHKKIT